MICVEKERSAQTIFYPIVGVSIAKNTQAIAIFSESVCAAVYSKMDFHQVKTVQRKIFCVGLRFDRTRVYL